MCTTAQKEYDSMKTLSQELTDNNGLELLKGRIIGTEVFSCNVRTFYVYLLVGETCFKRV